MGRHARTHLRDTAFKPVPIWLSPLTSFHKTATHSWVENSRNTGNLQSFLGHLPHTKHLTTLLTNLTAERNACSLPKLKSALLEPLSGTSFKGLLDRQMPQREKLVLAGNSNSTMMLHTAKDGFKVFLATEKKHIKDNHFQPSHWNRKASRETQGKIFFPDLFLQGQQRNKCTLLAQVWWMMGRAPSSRHSPCFPKTQSPLPLAVRTPVPVGQQYARLGCLIPSPPCN